MRRNQLFGGNLMGNVVVPVLGGAVGFIGARYIGNTLAMRDIVTTDPRTGKLIAAGVGIPVVYWLGRKQAMVRRNQGAIVLGMGLAAAEAYLRNTPLLGGGRMAAAVTEPAAAPMPGVAPEAIMPGEMNVEESEGGAGAYYTEGMLGGLGQDGESIAAVSTVIPTDLALRAPSMPQWAPVSERFVNRNNRGHAGGMFARHLFSGMMGG